MFEKIYNMMPRLFFLIALALLVFALWGKFIELFGWRYSFSPYSSGRILEFSGILLIFVITMLLRQIREKQKEKK